MEIERINENTVKLYLSNIDIENRGYTREELWNNRERSEQLFWEVMDEVDEREDFHAEGPLWIQVYTKGNGIEVVITRVLNGEHSTKDGQYQLEPPAHMVDGELGQTFEHIEDLLRESIEEDEEEEATPIRHRVFEFLDIEDLIQSASRLVDYEVNTRLFVYESKYYLHVAFEDVSEELKQNMIGILTEFAKKSDVTLSVLTEYGSVILEEKVFGQIQHYFQS